MEYLCPNCGRYEALSLFSEVPTYLVFLKNLVNKTSTLIDRLNSAGIPEDDFRRTILGGFNILTLSTIYDLQDYDKDIRYGDSRIPKEIRGSNPQLSHETMRNLVENIDIRNRISYVVISLFQFEHLFTELAKKTGFVGRENYSNVVHHVINNSKLEKKPEKIDAMILPSIVRNTLHSVGVYKDRKNRDKEITVKSIVFKFEHDKKHDRTSWREIIFYFNNIIEVIIEIFENEKTV